MLVFRIHPFMENDRAERLFGRNARRVRRRFASADDEGGGGKRLTRHAHDTDFPKVRSLDAPRLYQNQDFVPIFEQTGCARDRLTTPVRADMARSRLMR